MFGNKQMKEIICAYRKGRWFITSGPFSKLVSSGMSIDH